MRRCLITFDNLPASVLSCYGSFQNQTVSVNLIASVSTVYDQCFASTSKPFHPLKADTNKNLTLLHDTQGFPGTPFEQAQKSRIVPDLINANAETLNQLLQDAETSDIWIASSEENFQKEDLQKALTAWDHEAELTDGDLFNSLQNSTLTQPQVNRVLVTALTLARDRFLGTVWKVLAEVLDQGDQIIITAKQGDDRLAIESHPQWLVNVSEQVAHIPLIVHEVGCIYGSRNAGLLTCNHNFLNPPNSSEQPQQITYESSEATAYRTHEWLLVKPDRSISHDGHVDGTECVLFRKPEDIWEILDVANQYPGLVEEFLKTGELPSFS